MKTLTHNLRGWRKARNITEPNTMVYVNNVIEELLEIFTEDKKEIEYLQAEIFDRYFADRKPISELNTLDSIQDISVFSINETELMGYDNHKCNEEVFKHINSRKQDLEQKVKWEKFGTNGEKWKKDSTQSKDEIYQPKYKDCKR